MRVCILVKATKILTKTVQTKSQYLTESRCSTSVNVNLLPTVLHQHATEAQNCMWINLRGQNHVNPPLNRLYSQWQQAEVTLHRCDATVDLGLLLLFRLLCLLCPRHFLPNLKHIHLVRTFSPSTLNPALIEQHVPGEWKMSFLWPTLKRCLLRRGGGGGVYHGSPLLLVKSLM